MSCKLEGIFGIVNIRNNCNITTDNAEAEKVNIASSESDIKLEGKYSSLAITGSNNTINLK